MTKQDASSSADDLAKGVAGVIEAALGVGVAVARASAEFTAGGRTVSPPEPGAAPLSVLIHYGLATAGNLATLVSSAAAAPVPKPQSQPAPTAPRVRPGAKLRVPLSVENRGDKPMSRLRPQLRRVLLGGVEAASALPADCVTFAPQTLTVAPKDFEKLTVFVAVPDSTAAGRYDLVLALGPAEPDLPLSFDVVAEVGR
jgi:hypothetical protein